MICYCTIGYRSQKKVQELKKRNPDVKAYNLSDSMSWATTEAPALVDPKAGKETSECHVRKDVGVATERLRSRGTQSTTLSIVKGLFKKSKRERRSGTP